MPLSKKIQEIGQKRKIVVKIEFAPLSLDRKSFPFKKGFKKPKYREGELLVNNLGARESLAGA